MVTALPEEVVVSVVTFAEMAAPGTSGSESTRPQARLQQVEANFEPASLRCHCRPDLRTNHGSRRRNEAIALTERLRPSSDCARQRSVLYSRNLTTSPDSAILFLSSASDRLTVVVASPESSPVDLSSMTTISVDGGT